MKPIVITPNVVLSTPAKTVTSFDKRLQKLVRDMKIALRGAKNPKGVGLAAPQIGQSVRVFVTKPRDADPIRAFINPTIVSSGAEKTDGVPERDNKLEGCLSIPKIWGKVNRSNSLTLSYQDETGARHTENFSGFPAVIIQHETDHTNGILFIQRVLEQKGKLYQTAKDENGKEVLDEVTLS